MRSGAAKCGSLCPIRAQVQDHCETRPEGLAPRGERAVLRVRVLQGGLPIGRWAQAVECSLEDPLYITRVATDRRDGVDQVEDLFESEVVANLAGLLRGGEQRLAGGGDSGAAAVEHGVATVSVLEQLRGDVTFACEEGEELVQPGEEAHAGSLGGLADGVDLV